ncbi:hypothetical protein JW805_10895 [Roseomonas aeriglobus]|nr:hypothetical protein [Roseomonas aeriglobus]
MIDRLSRGLLRLATTSLRERRGAWADAMEAEADAAKDDGRLLSFAAGCLVAAGREAIECAQGRFILTNYLLVLVLLLPMATVQIGCALFGLPYLYPGDGGLAGAVTEGSAHEPLLRSLYQAAVPSLALAQLVTGVGHVRLAWALLERDWAAAIRWGLRTLAAATTLIVFLFVLFLDGRQAVLQAAILVIELAIITLVIRRHTQLFVSSEPEHPA